MRDLNYLRKLVMETIEEDVRKSSRNRKRLSESSKEKLHKRKLDDDKFYGHYHNKYF